MQMAVALMDGSFRSATELSNFAHVATSTASHHLNILLAANVIRVQPQGRHRYFCLASEPVADVIEALMQFGAQPPALPARPMIPLRAARTCYRHLAGALGVRIKVGLEALGVIESEGLAYIITQSGGQWLAQQGIQVRARAGKMCIDWTERQPHLAGDLGSAVLATFVDRDFVTPHPCVHRALILTDSGSDALRRWFEAPAL